jgi:4-hydroxy-3-methylbut-2-enyl diphosphate reductase IspH
VSKTHLVHAKHLAKGKYNSNITQDKEDVQLFQQLQRLYDDQNYKEPEVPVYTLDDVAQARLKEKKQVALMMLQTTVQSRMLMHIKRDKKKKYKYSDRKHLNHSICL